MQIKIDLSAARQSYSHFETDAIELIKGSDNLDDSPKTFKENYASQKVLDTGIDNTQVNQLVDLNFIQFDC